MLWNSRSLLLDREMELEWRGRVGRVGRGLTKCKLNLQICHSTFGNYRTCPINCSRDCGAKPIGHGPNCQNKTLGHQSTMFWPTIISIILNLQRIDFKFVC